MAWKIRSLATGQRDGNSRGKSPRTYQKRVRIGCNSCSISQSEAEYRRAASWHLGRQEATHPGRQQCPVEKELARHCRNIRVHVCNTETDDMEMHSKTALYHQSRWIQEMIAAFKYHYRWTWYIWSKLDNCWDDIMHKFCATLHAYCWRFVLGICIFQNGNLQ